MLALAAVALLLLALAACRAPLSPPGTPGEALSGRPSGSTSATGPGAGAADPAPGSPADEACLGWLMPALGDETGPVFGARPATPLLAALTCWAEGAGEAEMVVYGAGGTEPLVLPMDPLGGLFPWWPEMNAWKVEYELPAGPRTLRVVFRRGGQSVAGVLIKVWPADGPPG